jgi:hypothetical protein
MQAAESKLNTTRVVEIQCVSADRWSCRDDDTSEWEVMLTSHSFAAMSFKSLSRYVHDARG